MRERDRRALLVLGIWVGMMSAFWAGKRALAFRGAWQSTQMKIARAVELKLDVDRELAQLRLERANLNVTFSKELKDLTEDQLRLKGQAALLGAAEKAGIRAVRLRAETNRLDATCREQRWTLEGEGTLSQWVEACQGIEAAFSSMVLQRIRLEGHGNTWSAGDASSGRDGPSLKGGVLCSWILMTDSVEPLTPARPLPTSSVGHVGGWTSVR